MHHHAEMRESGKIGEDVKMIEEENGIKYIKKICSLTSLMMMMKVVMKRGLAWLRGKREIFTSIFFDIILHNICAISEDFNSLFFI